MSPRTRRGGFSIIELLMVLFFAGILAAIALPQFNRYMNTRSVINARDAFSGIAARAKAASVERGDVVMLRVRPLQDSIAVFSADGVDTLEVLNFATGEMRIDVIMAATTTVCYVPRGFAHPGCGSGSQLPMAIGFAAGADTLWSVINAIGQVERQ